jgi:hypothetical protein
VKQKLKDGYEYDLVSRWRKKRILVAKAGVWKYVKRRLNKRFRKARHAASMCQRSRDNEHTKVAEFNNRPIAYRNGPHL